MENFGKKIKYLCEISDLTVNQLSKKSGVSRVSISRCIDGGLPTLGNAFLLAKAFDVSLTVLVASEDENWEVIKKDHLNLNNYIKQAEKLEGMKR